MSRRPETPFDVRGRTVFITGAARGIGAATAERLHRKGANVALVGLEPERLQELATRLGERAQAFEADVTDFQALRRAVENTVERFGAIERGVERRSARVWAPRWVGPMIALRGLLQPLVERRVPSEPERVAEAVRLADPAAGSVAEQDPLLGVAAQTIE